MKKKMADLEALNVKMLRYSIRNSEITMLFLTSAKRTKTRNNREFVLNS